MSPTFALMAGIGLLITVGFDLFLRHVLRK